MADWNYAHRIKRRQRFDIDTAIAHFGVLIFPGQDLSDAQQIALSQRFIEIENEHGGKPTQKKKRLNVKINDVSNLKTGGTPLARDDRRRAFNLGNHGLVTKFPTFTAAARAHDWAVCAEQCRRRGISATRNEEVKKLFEGADNPI